jgi:hypothetical protein
MKSPWRGTFFAAMVVVACLAVFGVIMLFRFGSIETTATVAQAQTAAEVGVAPLGRTSFEFTGRIDQEGAIFRIYGYVTYLHDLPPGLLFTHPITHSEATARITISGTTTLTERTVISNVFHVDSAGIIRFYFDEDDGASFDDLASFGRGTLIGSANVRLNNILTVTGPNSGLANGGGSIEHVEAGTFEVGGEEYQFGRSGMIERVTFAGSGVRLVPEPPVAIIAVGGAGTVAAFDTFVPLTEK